MFNDIRYAFDDMAINAVSLPRGEDIGIDGRVMFAILLAVVTPLLFGLMPSLHASRADLRDALAEGGRSSSARRSRSRWCCSSAPRSSSAAGRRESIRSRPCAPDNLTTSSARGTA